ncbi:PAS domain-containing protein [Streptomyces sp. SID4951]|nr:PAS domain-containing protein [Streptomyces sp. SID4951]
MILLDPELRVVGFNTGTANMAGVRAEDILGRHVRDAYALAEPDEVEAMARGVLDSDVPVREHIVRGRRGGDPSRLRDVEVSVFRLRSPQGQVLGLAVSVVDVTERDPAHSEMIRAYSARSLLTAPLAVRGTVLGSISLYRTRRRDPFDQDDIDLALAVTDHIALYLDNARRYTREHSIAATVQRYLLPRRPISRMALETAYVPMASSGGGEWYDTIALSGARVAVVIGQVSAPTGRRSRPPPSKSRSAVCSYCPMPRCSPPRRREAQAPWRRRWPASTGRSRTCSTTSATAPR